MKFKVRVKKPASRVGDTRRRFKFCWRPRKTDDGYWVWLESVLVTEKYTRLTALIPEMKVPQQYSAWIVTEKFSSSSTLWQEYKGKI